jgi:tetratricopeptide (TPR) repeat protein
LLPLDGAVRVILLADRIEVHPADRLVYFPLSAPSREAPSSLFLQAEELEFRRQDYRGAIANLRRLSSASDPAIRAGALLRLARNLRKADDREAALDVYRELARMETASLTGVPAELLARRARCAVLGELGRTTELHQEAMALAVDLEKGRWRLDRGAYLHAVEQVSHWLAPGWRPNPEQEALAAAVEWMWQMWTENPRTELAVPGRRCLVLDGLAVTALWRPTSDGLIALLTGPSYQQKNWFASLGTMRVALTAAKNQPIFGDAPRPGSARTQRAASETGLPWSVVVTSDVHAGLDPHFHF